MGFAAVSKGNRPSLTGAAGPDKAIPLYELLAERLGLELGRPVWSGLVLKPHDRESVAIDTLNKRIAKDSRVENVLLTVRDGIQVVRKKT